jgi:hypothetical protein
MSHSSTPALDREPATFTDGSEGRLPAIEHAPANPDTEWTLAQRIGFRVLFAYAFLYTAPFPLGDIPKLEAVEGPYAAAWRNVVPWVGQNILHLSSPVSLRPSGSGDRLFNYVQVFTELLLAVCIAIVWSVLARRRRNHGTLFASLHAYLRFFLAVTLLRYGADKVIPNQFEPMNPVRLTQYFGEAAPGGFAWSFLGFSIPYMIFAGLGETVSALLLFSRRTATLGAAVGAAVMSNVFMLNMSYDIPVKQFAGHLLLFLCFLVACDGRRLVNLFVRNEATTPATMRPLIPSSRWNRAFTVAAAVFAAWIVVRNFKQEVGLLHQFGRLQPKSPIAGIFELETMAKNGVLQQPLMTDPTLWRRLATNGRNATIRYATDSLARYRIRIDSVKQTVTFTVAAETASQFTLSFVKPDSAHLALRGRIGSDSVDLRLRRRDERSFFLVSRGFHWVNEAPVFR